MVVIGSSIVPAASATAVKAPAKRDKSLPSFLLMERNLFSQAGHKMAMAAQKTPLARLLPNRYAWLA